MEWFVKLFTFHSHRWGRWENRRKNMQRTNISTGKILHTFVQYYQQRKCTTCGELQQRDMEYDPGDAV